MKLRIMLLCNCMEQPEIFNIQLAIASYVAMWLRMYICTVVTLMYRY